jgi:hypothetical protein
VIITHVLVCVRRDTSFLARMLQLGQGEGEGMSASVALSHIDMMAQVHELAHDGTGVSRLRQARGLFNFLPCSYHNPPSPRCRPTPWCLRGMRRCLPH